MKIAIILLFSLFYAFPVSAQTLRDDRYPSWEGRMRGNYTARELGIRKVSLKKKRHYRRHRHHQHVMRNVARRQENHTIRFLADAGEAFATPFKQMAAVIGGRPSGCPHRFCACALSLKLFGRQVPGLNLAANWLRFPRVAPSSGMVAARRGHVFQLLSHVSGNSWQVWDANSGHGRIRVHTRSIAGFAIVNPNRNL